MPEGYFLFEFFRSELINLRGKRPKAINFSYELSFKIHWKGLDIMPRAKRNKNETNNSTSKRPNTAVSWINIQLTDDDVQRLISQGATDDELAVDFLTLCGYGYSIGCKPAPNGEGWMAYLTGKPDEDADDVVGISGYANTPIDACSSLLFKFHDKLGGILIKPEPKSTRRFG